LNSFAERFSSAKLFKEALQKVVQQEE